MNQYWGDRDFPQNDETNSGDRERVRRREYAYEDAHERFSREEKRHEERFNKNHIAERFRRFQEQEQNRFKNDERNRFQQNFEYSRGRGR